MNRYRFAPSPTGHLHIGGARTALYNYLMARKTGAKFVLRIEDTDRERSTKEYETSILKAMEWLGLDWDEGPFYQSERSALYQEQLEKLLNEGKAYRCFCTAETLTQKREAAMAAKQKPKYDGTCRDIDPQVAAQDPRPHCIRFRSQDTGSTVFTDAIKGRVEVQNSELDDLIIARTDGTPTYNLVVVIDDMSMGITQVIRGDDHINNTPRQIQLYEALGYPVPVFAHVPMILGEDKKRLSKRHGATSVMAYQEAGYLPEALNNYLVRLGWSFGDEEIFSKEDLSQKFSIDKVGHSAAIFNTEKLNWLNGHWIRQLEPKRLLELTKPFLNKLDINLSDEAYAQQALVSCQEKAKTLNELAQSVVFYFREEVFIDDKAKKKGLSDEGLQVLGNLLPGLLAVSPFDKTNLEKFLQDFGEKHSLKFGKIGPPLRAALAGTMASPNLYDILSILGKERVEKRVRRVL